MAAGGAVCPNPDCGSGICTPIGGRSVGSQGELRLHMLCHACGKQFIHVPTVQRQCPRCRHAWVESRKAAGANNEGGS